MEESTIINTINLKNFDEKDTTTVQMNEVCLEGNACKSEPKKPKRVIYFSDGAVEEFSDEEEEEKPTKQLTSHDKASTWSSYIIENLDHMGEKLAWFFGITSPKYQYAIDEYWRRKREEEEEKETEAREEAVAIERRGRRNAAMDREAGMSVVTFPDCRAEPRGSDACVTCKQPTSVSASDSPLVESRGGLDNEGFDDSFKY